MGTGLLQVNFLWLGERFSRSPLALWYSLRSTSSALGSGRLLSPPFSQTNFKTQSRICHFSCMWFQLHLLKWWQTVITGRPNNCLPPHLYSAASCPSFIYSSWPHFPSHLTHIVIAIIIAKRRQLRLPYRKQNILIFSVKYGNFAEGNISPVMSSVPQHIRKAPSLFLKELITSCVHFWSRWRSAPTWFQCCSISSYH